MVLHDLARPEEVLVSAGVPRANALLGPEAVVARLTFPEPIVDSVTGLVTQRVADVVAAANHKFQLVAK
jgi:hypothetical protein